MSDTQIPSTLIDVGGSRRSFLRRSALLSGAAVALLGGVPLRGIAAHNDAQASSDVNILNVALGLEHEGIAAYQIGAGSGLLDKPTLAVASLFLSHHEGHREVLMGAIKKMGGTPVAAKTTDEYKASEKLNVKAIKTAADVLRLAQRLELGAANAYIGVMPSFTDRSLSQVAGRLIADETMHWTALTQALGEALPKPTLSFGA
ncbi:Ferritin-like domain-containing protein [Solimonas aquatica]|uniref:Ferritin-like domain-containing protein n=1 Tax=Solimonas aquatica TaxID=489703 RepID=A0A1H9A989_9GAMM|nr:ferritin-like domain-containing protein [Solimonas aquatica]SEP73229.1 Ferritin-like domain-containing protein [Solimonas aquatica]